MSKKSAASLSIVQVTPLARVGIPEDLSASEMALWRGVVDSKPADWFGEDSAPLLKEYVRAVTMCDYLQADIQHAMDSKDLEVKAGLRALLDMRDKESKRVLSTGTKLRLTPQSRYTPQTASTAAKKVAGGGKPWQS